MNNYLAATIGNKYGLQPPPMWWLNALWHFDPALVVFPSCQRRAYILARRRGYSNTARMAPLVKLNNDLLRMTVGTDGDVMAANNLVFVDTIINAFGNWTNAIFNMLRSRDTWTAGGADKYAKLLDAQDAAEAMKRQKAFADDQQHRINDAWRSRQARLGQRNHHAKNTGQRVRGFATPASGKSTSSSTTGSGLIVAP